MFGEGGGSRTVVLEPIDESYQYNDWTEETGEDFNSSNATIKLKFKEFIKNFSLENIFHYRELLLKQYNRRSYFISIDISHIREFDEVLFNKLLSSTDETLSLFERATKDVLRTLLPQENNNQILPEFQIILSSGQALQSLRTITAEHANALVKVPGIIINCSKTKSKAIEICIKCTECRAVKKLSNRSPMGAVSLPQTCDRNGAPGEDKCGSNPYTILADECQYVNQQTLKLQESPEVVPTGEIPRSILLVAERSLVDLVTPGTRVAVLGIVSMYTNTNSMGNKAKGISTSSVRNYYLRVIGYDIESDGSRNNLTSFTSQEEEEMLELSRDPNIYEKLANSIAPQIKGDYTYDLKKAIACLLMGGSRKVLPDGVKLRGDINILLMGDPSTAKSQFLKFVESVSPIGVYTSGKGSSAAGLTASVIRDNRGEFYLEGGAMVLADGGVICIDEFDKMRENDRVAIHEAMEQQTISIAKAGITTMLNCRNSVLAAANPIHGRYDDLKNVDENINLMSTILSRFDCIFIIRDIREQERDRQIARHVLNVHISSSLIQNNESDINENIITPAKLKKFITYCRERCAPRLSPEANLLLNDQFVSIRNQVRESKDSSTVPITIRQLEAIIRLSEALAKMRLSSEATVSDVEEALRLFKISTLAASQSNPLIQAALTGNPNSNLNNNLYNEMQYVENYLRKRIPIKSSIGSRKLLDECAIQGYTQDSIRLAIRTLVLRGELQELNQGKVLKRVR